MVVFDVSGSDASGGNASPIVPDVSGQFEDIPTSGETLQQEVVTYPGNTEVVTILQDCQYILIGVGLLVGMLFALGFPSSRK